MDHRINQYSCHILTTKKLKPIQLLRIFDFCHFIQHVHRKLVKESVYGISILFPIDLCQTIHKNHLGSKSNKNLPFGVKICDKCDRPKVLNHILNGYIGKRMHSNSHKTQTQYTRMGAKI